MDAWAPSQTLINIQTHQKRTLATQGVVISPILLSFGYLFKWFLPKKSEAAPKSPIIMWLLEFDWELELNSTKEQYRSHKKSTSADSQLK